MIENLNELEKRIASHFGSDLNHRLVIKGTHPKVVTPYTVGYLARTAYQRGVSDSVKYIEELLKRYSLIYIRYKIKDIINNYDTT